MSRAYPFLNSILNKMASTKLDLGEPVYSMALERARRAVEEKDPYRKLSEMFTALAQFAYAAQLHLARKQGLKWMFDILPPSPVAIEIVEDSLPETLLSEIVESATVWIDTYVRSIVNGVRQGTSVYVNYYVDSIPLRTIAAMSRYKDDIDRAVQELRKVIAAIEAREVSTEVELMFHDGAPRELVERGFKEFIVLSGTHRGTDPAKFEEIVRELGFEVRIHELRDLRVVVATKRFGNVELHIDCDSHRFGFVRITFVDRVPEIPMPKDSESEVVVENVKVIPVSIETPSIEVKRLVEVRKVQRIGGKLALYLTKALEMIGVTAGDEVEIIVDSEKREIVIRPRK